MSSRVSRPPKDPAAPKRNMSAYLLYQNAMRDTFKQQNPGMTFGQLSKYTSAMYAEMPQEEKDAWAQRAEGDKQRYLTELSNYVPPPGYDVKGDAIAAHAAHAPGAGVGVTKRRGRQAGDAPAKTARDPNAPKRNMSAYLLYQNCMREQFKAQNPGMTFGQLAKYTSHMYKCLSQEEKNKWEAHAAQDKARYEAEMTTYVPPAGYDATGNLVEDRRLNKKYLKKTRDPAQPKRARGSFVFFTFDARPQVAKEKPGIKFVDMGVVLGERWRALDPKEKQKYEDKAAEDKARFNKEMAAYAAERAAAAPPPAAPPPRAVYAGPPAAAPAGHAPHPGHAPPPGAYPPPEGYDHAAAAAHHAYYADPNAAYYADPNQPPPDPYAAHHPAYYPPGGQYHYA